MQYESHKVSIERSGEYINIFANGELRMSLSESHDEVLVYEDGIEEPVGVFTFEEGERKL